MRVVFRCQATYKPGSVENDHLSSYAITCDSQAVKTACLAEPPARLGAKQTSLQQAGFTSWLSHLSQLWALTLASVHKSPRLSQTSWAHSFHPYHAGCVAVSFLWHFPWGYPRLRLTTAPSFAARTFLLALEDQAIIQQSDDHYYNVFC